MIYFNIPNLPREIIGKIFYHLKCNLAIIKLQNAWKKINMRRKVIYEKVMNIFDDLNCKFKYYYNKNIDINCLRCISRLFCKKFKNDEYLQNHFCIYFNSLLKLHLLSKYVVRKLWEYEMIYYKMYKQLITREYQNTFNDNN